MRVYGTRTSIIGMLIYSLYLQQKYAEVDTVIAMARFYAGVVDVYVVAKEGNPGYALFRAIPSLAIGACGYAGLTAGKS